MSGWKELARHRITDESRALMRADFERRAAILKKQCAKVRRRRRYEQETDPYLIFTRREQ